MQDLGEKVGTVKFTSPINKENSFCSWNVAESAESTMDLYYYRDNSGFIEWDIPAIDEVVHIGLEFDIDRSGKRTLADYDGVFDLPDQALDLLAAYGVDVAEMRATLRDHDLPPALPGAISIDEEAAR